MSIKICDIEIHECLHLRRKEKHSAHFDDRCKINVEHTIKVGDIEHITDQSLEWKPNFQVF